MFDHIRQRRAELAAQLDAGRAQYDALEDRLKELDRQLCMLAGGIAELDALINSEETHPAACAPLPAPA